MSPQEALQRTIEHREIFHDEMVELMRQIMGGEVSPVMTAAILSGLRVKKETVGEMLDYFDEIELFPTQYPTGEYCVKSPCSNKELVEHPATPPSICCISTARTAPTG